jgi:hypothetical protein
MRVQPRTSWSIFILDIKYQPNDKPTIKMADYLNKKEFDSEMLKCVAQGKLTNKSIEMFTLLATEISTTYNYRNEDIRKDAIDSAVCDFSMYWAGWIYKPTNQIKFVRNFVSGEKIHIFTPDGMDATFTARSSGNIKDEKYQFAIGATINKSIENLMSLIDNSSNGSVTCKPHKVTFKISIIDEINSIESGNFGMCVVTENHDHGVLTKVSKMGIDVTKIGFGLPPPAFNYFTSMSRNGILKFLDKFYPKNLRHGGMIYFSDMVENRLSHDEY